MNDQAARIMANGAAVFASAVACLARIEAMKAANRYRERRGFADAYAEDAFAALEERYCLGANQITATLQRGL